VNREKDWKNLFLVRFLKKPFGAISVLYLLLVLLAALAPGLLTAGDPIAVDFKGILQTPSAQYPLGTDSLGRDLLVRIIYSAAPALGGVVIALAVATALAVPLGLAAGLRGGWVDNLITRVSEILQSIPGIMILLMVMALTSQNLQAAMVTFGILVSPGAMRVVRGVTLGVREEPYIAAARVAGLNTLQIAIRHILKRVTGPILVNLSIVAALSLLAQASLNFLGLGVRPPSPTWGSMLSEASRTLMQEPWSIIPPGLVIAVTIVALILFGDSLRDTLSETWSKPRSLKRDQSAALPEVLEIKKEAVVEFEDAYLRVRNLTVTFKSDQGPIHVVQNVSFDLRRNESLGLVGESGCGKTMTGLALLGLLPDRATATGEIWLDGQELLSLPKRQRASLRGNTIAFISQEPMVALDPLFTIGFQIAEAVKTHHPKLSKKEVHSRVIQLLEQVRINDPYLVAKKYPHEISGGMAQRVAIAIALSGEPKLLIADEPTTALDVSVQKEILSLLELIQTETGMSVLLVSHDWGVVSELCERAVVMYAGEVVEQATVRSITHSPSHPYSQGLMRANPHFAKRGLPLITIGGSVPSPQNWPTSCHFADRCNFASAACREKAIPLVKVGESHSSRCIQVELVTKASK
jgi:peptide/nickel transport system permease protein